MQGSKGINRFREKLQRVQFHFDSFFILPQLRVISAQVLVGKPVSLG